MSDLRLNQLKALLAAVFWGASFVATKAAVQEISPITLIVLRFALGVLVLLFAVVRMRVLKWVGARDFVLLAILGAIAIFIHQALQATGLMLTTASSMSWLVALQPAFTAILALFILHESFNLGKIFGLVIAFVGAIVVVTRGAPTADTLHLPSTTGDLLAVASALNWTIFTVASKPLLRRMQPTLMMAYVMFIGWALTLPFFVVTQGWNQVSHLSMNGWLAVIYLGIFCSGIAYIFWYDALAHIDASKVSAFIYVEPIVTVVVAGLLLGEELSPMSFIGGLAILLGVYLVNRSGARLVAAREPSGVSIASD
ncbi:MAG: DMT family transporter [Chloroflexi bacterium]|nr:DMT family transporter [Chloroflexota bacterium]